MCFIVCAGWPFLSFALIEFEFNICEFAMTFPNLTILYKGKVDFPVFSRWLRSSLVRDDSPCLLSNKCKIIQS